MRLKLLRWYLPFVLLAVAYGGYIAISSGNAEALKTKLVEVP